MAYTKRFYRNWQNPDGLVSFAVRCRETDLMVYAEKDLAETTLTLVKKYRSQIEETIEENPDFKTSLIPLTVETSYQIIAEMVDKSRLAGVGPMAGVAGALSEFVGRELLDHTDGLIIENGGDVFIRSRSDRTVLVYAGEKSPFKDRVKLLLKGREEPFGVCTSSAAVGPSVSFGNTDAVVVVASSAVTADVFATAVGNRVKRADDLEPAIEYVRSFPDISGVLIMIGDRMAVFGEIRLM
jgi:ApbE superfamily uncharacterized protein (UPF0280 family)